MADTIYIKDGEDIFSLLNISDQNLPGIDERVTRLEDIVLTLDVSEGGSIATVVADISTDVAAGTIIELPAEASGKRLTYGVANNSLVVTYNGVWLYKDEHYEEIGESNTISSHIRTLQELRAGDKLSFQIFANNIGVMVDDASIEAASGQGLSVKVDNETLEISDTGVAVKNPVATGSTTARSLADRFSDVINVKDFGAKGDGVTDDTAAIQVAVNKGGTVFLPAGVYIVKGIIVSDNTTLCGVGANVTTLKLAEGANADVIKSAGADALWGDTEYGVHKGVANVCLKDFSVDGSRDTNSKGNGIALYGHFLHLENLIIYNTRGNGLRTEWGLQAPTANGMEGFFSNLRIHHCGEHGWLCNGPHDSVVDAVIIYDIARNAAKGIGGAEHDCFHLGNKFCGRFTACHGYNTAQNYRNRYALCLENSSDNHFIACSFEGAWEANTALLGSSQFNQFIACSWFANSGTGTEIFIDGTSNFNRFDGHVGLAILWALETGEPCAIRFGNSEGAYIAYNDFVLKDTGNPKLFYASEKDGGNNTMTLYSQPNNTPFAGAGRSPSDSITLYLGKDKYESRVKRKFLELPAGQATIWEFDTPFPFTPFIDFSVLQNTAHWPATQSVFVTAISATSCTIYNASSGPVNVDIKAEAHHVF